MSHLPHALIYAGLCSLPLLIMLPLWLLDAGRPPRNEIIQEQPGDGSEDECDPGPGTLLAAA